MFNLFEKSAIGARLASGLYALSKDEWGAVDQMRVVQYMAGVLVETYLVFEDPDQALNTGFTKLCSLLNAEPVLGDLGMNSLPPAHVIDVETEKGREIAREVFEENMECAFEFHDLILSVMHNMIVGWEDDGVSRGETLRLLIECTLRCMAFEIAAQELCDIMIDVNIADQGWKIGDCVSGLSAISGSRLAISLNTEFCMTFRGSELPFHLDQLSTVMTAEAVRLGVPAGSDWRFGLPANDMPPNAPYALIAQLEPICESFFDTIHLMCEYDQAVACAKAAGRMLAVAAGGECPEIEPAIAKPMAMAAITESYKSVCIDQQIVAY